MQAFAQGDESQGFWLWTLMGKLHPMIVHFPISFLLVAFFMELISWRRRSTDLYPATRLLLQLAGLTAIVAVVMGLLLEASGDYGEPLMTQHKITGIVTMILAVATAGSYHFNVRRLNKPLLALSVAAVTIAGHLGASLTHGEDYLSGALPGQQNAIPASDFRLITSVDSLSQDQIQELNVQVRTILAHHCYRCHGSGKVKGELRLDSREGIMKGGENGMVIIPGNASSSEMIRRVSLPRGHEDAMPEKGKAPSKEEVALLTYWIDKGAPWPNGPEQSLYRVAKLAPRKPRLPDATDLTTPVDKFVDHYFDSLGIGWIEPVDDRTFIRRVYLDIIGLLPPPDSIDAFISWRGTQKRERLVKQLLARNDDYAQHWLTFWNDALRNDYSGTGYITGGRFDITRWLYESLKENKPYNRFVGELISPVKESAGFIRGIQWRGTINASQRTEMQAAQNVAQVFLGLNIKCASCHDSFISDWKLDEAYAFANIFSDSTLEINRCDKPTGRMAAIRMLFPELGTIDAEAVTSERLKQLADFLVQPEDGRLYRTLVNRIWAQLLGRGIVEPVDAMDNAPWSQDLLDWLAFDFVESGYDIKDLIFKITTSRTYQLPSVALKEEAFVTASDFQFRGMIRRRLTAEQFADAVSQSIDPLYPDSAVVFNLLPETVVSEMPFARASLVKNDRFLTALGRPNRETVSTSRSSQANLLQALELTNGSLFNKEIEHAASAWRPRYETTDALVRAVYRRTLGRLPMKEELAVATESLGQNPSPDKVADFLWSMTLHPEFQLIY
jgi:uncharacterized membrane protein